MKNSIFISFIVFLLTCFTYSQQWTQTASTPEGAGITDMVVTSNGTIIVTCASFNFPTGQGGIRHSTNSGATWINDFQHYTARTLALGQGDFVFASSWNYPTTSEGLYVSTNQGVTWGAYRYLIGASNNIFSILVRDNNQTVYIGTRNGIMKSTNGGYNFTAVNNGIPANSFVRDLAAKPDGNIYAATTNGVFRSTNTGTSWQQMTGVAPGDTVVKLTIYDPPGDGNNPTVVGGTNNGKVYEEGAELFLASFFIANNTNEFGMLEGLAIAIFAAQFNESGNPGDMYKFYEASGWQYVGHNEGLPGQRPISSGAVDPASRDNLSNVQLYIGYFENANGGAKVFKRTFPIGIQQISSEVPNGFSLSQNYPNPFNPTTKIKFQISKLSNAKFIVYDASGKEVETLVNENLKPGTYEAEFNGSNLSSGVYFYKLVTEDFTETKKMVMAK